ncbi:MAG: hypothetical protein Q9208_001212 [Pyrenodesmia sp. 3 TL-2023]
MPKRKLFEVGQTADEELKESIRDQPSKYQKMVISGTWQHFLYRDAVITRKAFFKWWSSKFVKSRQGKALAREARRQVEELMQTSEPPTSVDRTSLRPDVLDVLLTWEAIPPGKGSPEERNAKVRLLADWLRSGEYAERINRGEALFFDYSDIRDARQWLHKKADGTIERYEPLRQVWTYKYVVWNSEKKVLGFMPGKVSDDSNLPAREISSILRDPESVKISRQTLKELVAGTWFTPPATLPSPEHSSAEENPDDSFISQILLDELDTVAAEAS